MIILFYTYVTLFVIVSLLAIVGLIGVIFNLNDNKKLTFYANLLTYSFLFVVASFLCILCFKSMGINLWVFYQK